MRVLLVPGLAVPGYASAAALALRSQGLEAEVLPAPAQTGVSSDLRRCGEDVADRLRWEGRVIDLLVGFSVGTQVAAVTAAATPLVRRLLLVSPTVDPAVRAPGRLLAAWAANGGQESPALLLQQLPEWRRAGLGRLRRGMASAMRLRLEEVLPDTSAQVTVVHAEHDRLTSHAYASSLACAHGGRLVTIPGASHSWPHQDPERFVDVVQRALL